MRGTMQIATEKDRARIADEAQCDRRTVAKFLRGERVRPLARQRIAMAMLTLGLGLPPKGATTPAQPSH